MNPRAFTLVELLAVLAITGILAALSLPAISSLTAAGGVNQAVSEISLLLDQARAYAMAHSTYVWVGFASDTASQKLTIAVLAGTTGETEDLGASSTCVLVSKLETYNHLGLDNNLPRIPSMASSGDDISTSSVNAADFQKSVPSNAPTFDYVLQFSPAGEASIGKTVGISHCIQIGLQPVRAAAENNANVAAVQVATLTGQVQVFRP